jgi:hypothetical protein
MPVCRHVCLQGGRYCPNTTAMLDCQAGHFCKSGSSKMQECPPLLGCPPGTESPTDNKLGFALNACLFLLLAITWQATQLYSSLMRRLSRRERMKVMWNSKTSSPEVCGFSSQVHAKHFVAHCSRDVTTAVVQQHQHTLVTQSDPVMQCGCVLSHKHGPSSVTCIVRSLWSKRTRSSCMPHHPQPDRQQPAHSLAPRQAEQQQLLTMLQDTLAAGWG